MKNDETLEYLISQGVVAVIRMKDPQTAGEPSSERSAQGG